MPYVACHVDLFVARATYELQAMDDERAKAEAKEYLTSTSPLRYGRGTRWIASSVKKRLHGYADTKFERSLFT